MLIVIVLNNNNNNNNFISCSIIKLCPHQKAYNMHASKRKKTRWKKKLLYKCECTKMIPAIYE